MLHEANICLQNHVKKSKNKNITTWSPLSDAQKRRNTTRRAHTTARYSEDYKRRNKKNK